MFSACNCHNHATECYYSEQVAQQKFVAIVNTIHMEITVRGVNQAIIVLLGCPRRHLMSVKVRAISG